MKPRSAGTLWSIGAVVVCSLLFPPGEAVSQEQPTPGSPITVGSKVRLVAPTVVRGRIEGLVTHLDERSLVVGTLSVPRQAIAQLEVSTGRRGHALKGMLIGAVVGVGAGAALPAALCAGQSCEGEGEGKAALIGAGALGGAIWGVLIGHLVKSDRWSSLPPERARVSLAPARGLGVRLSLSVGW